MNGMLAASGAKAPGHISALIAALECCAAQNHATQGQAAQDHAARRIMLARSRSRSEERRVGKSVDLGGRRIIKKKQTARTHGSSGPARRAARCLRRPHSLICP